MPTTVLSLITNAFVSSLLFALLIVKAKIQLKYIYIDNIITMLCSTAIVSVVVRILSLRSAMFVLSVSVLATVLCIIIVTMLRFYRDPERHHNATASDILAPADGFVTYIKKIEPNNIPFSIKGKTISKLNELTKVDILDSPCWLIGVVMTLFDAHVNRAPVSGKVVLNHYSKGKFLSLKQADSEVENERNTMVIKNGNGLTGVVQIASKRVRGIETCVRLGDSVSMGDRIGMIRFGSQTDIIFPVGFELKAKIGQRVYAGTTVLASLKA